MIPAAASMSRLRFRRQAALLKDLSRRGGPEFESRSSGTQQSARNRSLASLRLGRASPADCWCSDRTGYASPDGKEWTRVGAVDATFPQTVEAGLSLINEYNANIFQASFSEFELLMKLPAMK